jgi:hypothetical protein
VLASLAKDADGQWWDVTTSARTDDSDVEVERRVTQVLDEYRLI